MDRSDSIYRRKDSKFQCLPVYILGLQLALPL